MTANRDDRSKRLHYRARVCAGAGFTLLEMLLVLAILAAMAAMSFPTLDRMHRTHRLQRMVSEIRTKLAATRLHAIDDGIEYQFRFEPGGRHLLAIPLQRGALRFGAADEDGSNAARGQARAWSYHAELPEGLYFATDGDSRERLAFESLCDLENPSALANVSWSAPVVFSTSGAATQTAFEVWDHDGRFVEVAIRGLTGVASVSPVQQKGRR